jgi:hypothetical protein
VGDHDRRFPIQLLALPVKDLIMILILDYNPVRFFDFRSTLFLGTRMISSQISEAVFSSLFSSTDW